ncbi:MAG: hypothetical protein IT215_03335 [Chitinophagaceae bacterium]|nr:hypothetical protein [Chitinophagaceae bacterium]
MKRIFITTDVEKAKGLYVSTVDDTNPARKQQIEIDFATLPKVYEYGTDFKIIIIKDDFKNWSDYSIVKEIADESKDYILYHETSTQEVKEAITTVFNATHIVHGSHIVGASHDKVYRILFDNDNNKAQRIIEFLFPTADTILGKKLDLLHSLLVPPVDFADAKEQWKKIKEAVDEARTRGVVVSFPADVLPLTDFETAVSNITGAFDKALTKLRDTLLV